ncbi:hypothetical protein RJT34_33518 [Clitoria ternatea]|uniref:Uncharacterized protein n=1 Tax=Clitoria ternatea TaxID=43366 RepID=A0AAN9F623_CLITE
MAHAVACFLVCVNSECLSVCILFSFSLSLSLSLSLSDCNNSLYSRSATRRRSLHVTRRRRLFSFRPFRHPTGTFFILFFPEETIKSCRCCAVSIWISFTVLWLGKLNSLENFWKWKNGECCRHWGMGGW